MLQVWWFLLRNCGWVQWNFKHNSTRLTWIYFVEACERTVLPYIAGRRAQSERKERSRLDDSCQGIGNPVEWYMKRAARRRSWSWSDHDMQWNLKTKKCVRTGLDALFFTGWFCRAHWYCGGNFCLSSVSLLKKKNVFKGLELTKTKQNQQIRHLPIQNGNNGNFAPAAISCFVSCQRTGFACDNCPLNKKHT